VLAHKRKSLPGGEVNEGKEGDAHNLIAAFGKGGETNGGKLSAQLTERSKGSWPKKKEENKMEEP